MKNPFLHAFVLACLAGAGCQKPGYSYTGKSIEDYMPLHAGHSITYRLDSFVYTHFGTVLEQHSYIAKDSIENPVTDAGGRPSWRMVRYYRNDNDPTVWQPAATCMITPLARSIEMVENNLRYIKLTRPVQEGYSWAGNSYLPFQPYGFAFDFASSDHNQPGSWHYVYRDLDKKDTINQFLFDNTLTVVCDAPDSSNFPPQDLNANGNRTAWIEQYAKGVGLVYKHVVMQEYQPANVLVPTPYYTGFELTMSIIAYQ